MKIDENLGCCVIHQMVKLGNILIKMYPEFADEPRNVRLALCSDGFSPFNNSTPPYSCWPVIITPYNLPPELCMTTPFMFLTLINPTGKIDVYLQPFD